MKTTTTRFIFLSLLLIGFAGSANAQKKRAQTAFKFISTPLAARAAGMSDAVYSLDSGADAMFQNPATMSRQTTMFDIIAGQVQYIADINYHYAALSYAPKKGLYGIIGVSLMSVDYGDFQGTIRANNELGYEDVGIFKPMSFGIGISYARAISGQFSIGGTVKYLGMSLGRGTVDLASDESRITEEFDANVIAYDFGVHYKTGWKSLELGFTFKNLAPEIRFNTEDSEIPLTFRMGASLDLIDLTDINKDIHSLVLSVNANRPRDFDEQVFVGTDYTFLKRFSLRAGYLLPTEEQGLSFGAGFRQPITRKGVAIKVDYAYTNFGIFNAVNRLTVQFSF